MSKILVVGGGAAGMMAAVFAARNGNEVIIYEKNEKLGKKLYITGKGRCNITNASEMETLFQSVTSNSKFLYSAFYGFTNFDAIDFFEGLGCKTKIERGNRVFPVSDKSSDVIIAMTRELQRLGVQIEYRTEVEEVVALDGQFEGIRIKGKKELIKGDKVIIATGGLSYHTGSGGVLGAYWQTDARDFRSTYIGTGSSACSKSKRALYQENRTQGRELIVAVQDK